MNHNQSEDTTNRTESLLLQAQNPLTKLPSLTWLAAMVWQVWLKPSAEMSFLYGNNILKSGLGRITEFTPAHTGVLVLSMSDIPLGFGVSGKSTAECRKADPSAIVVYHQADVGAMPRCAQCRPGHHLQQCMPQHCAHNICHDHLKLKLLYLSLSLAQ